MVVSRKRVQRLVRIMGLRAIYQGNCTSQMAPEHRIYPGSSSSAPDGLAGFGTSAARHAVPYGRHPLRQVRYCLAILNGPKSTGHEYLSFPCLLSPSNEGLTV